MTELNQEEIELKVLSNIIKSEDALLKAINKNINSSYFCFKPESIEIPFYSRIYQIITEFYAKYNEIISFDSFQKEINNKKINSDSKIRDSIISYIIKTFIKIQSEDNDNNYEYLLDCLIDRTIKREIFEYLPNMKDVIKNKNPIDALDDIISKFSDIRSTKGNPGQRTLTINAAGSAEEILSLYEEEKSKLSADGGLKIGIPEIDNATNGFREGQLIVILGELGKGKSTVLLNWAIGAQERGNNILFFSFEMPRWQCLARYMAIKTNRMYEEYKNTSLSDKEYNDWKEFLIEQEKTNNSYLQFIDQPDNTTTEEIESKIRHFCAADRKPDAIFVDYLGNMALTESSGGMKEYEIIAKATTKLRQLARRYRIPVITAQQINRDGLKGIRKKEETADFDKIQWQPEMVQDSKKTMDYADFVIGINPCFDANDPSGQNYMWFHKVKARDTHFDPFCALYIPQMAKIIPIEKNTNTIKYLFDNSNYNQIFAEEKTIFDLDDDVGDLE